LGSGEVWAELAGGEGVQFAEALGEFGGGYAALAAESAQKIVGGGFSFLRVAFGAAGDEIAVGIFAPASQPMTWSRQRVRGVSSVKQ